MFQADPRTLAALAPALTILHQSTGALEPFVPTNPQRRVWAALWDHARVVVLKGRQVYISTAVVLYALAFAMVNPGVKVALVADIAEKAEGLLAKATAWARELGMETPTANTKRLVLWNGAELHAITANSADVGSGEVKAGRSFSYGLIILSEFAFYTRDSAILASLTRSALAGARIIIETTATPAENAFRSLWDGGPGWEHVFLSFEEHEAYQADPGSIDDATWADLQSKYEFTSRPHAAYWWRMVQTDMNGDVHRGLREAPVKPEHAFAFAEGRWIFRYDEAVPVSVDGCWSHYEDTDESGVIIGVDTASGVGADASAIAVVGRARGNLVATWTSRTVKVPEFIDVVKAALARWRPMATLIEGNGIGKGVFQAVSATPGVRVFEHTTHDAEKPVRMNVVKLAIEAGEIVAGPELEHEVKHSMMLRPRRAGGGPLWDGPDDLLNALGFALVYRREHPWRAKVVELDPRKHVDRAAYRKARGRSSKVF
jgi:hypothetical protein